VAGIILTAYIVGFLSAGFLVEKAKHPIEVYLYGLAVGLFPLPIAAGVRVIKVGYHGFRAWLGLGGGAASTTQIQKVVDNIRHACGGQCEKATDLLRKALQGGHEVRFADDRLLHSAYRYGNKIYDLTAKQYVRPGVWTEEELAKAGLTEAVNTGVFTLEQHALFMEKIIRVFGGVLEK